MYVTCFIAKSKTLELNGSPNLKLLHNSLKREQGKGLDIFEADKNDSLEVSQMRRGSCAREIWAFILSGELSTEAVLVSSCYVLLRVCICVLNCMFIIVDMKSIKLKS
ncbi:hypothetical protein HN51_020539 [Arachis hypogaea]